MTKVNQYRSKAAVFVFLAAAVGLAASPSSSAADKERQPATRYAVLFAESVQDANAAPMFGISISNLQWCLHDANGAKTRKIDLAKKGQVRPIGQTVTLKREHDRLTLLGPDGGTLTLSLTKGPLADAKVLGDRQLTTFAFSPNKKQLVFANAAGEICSLDLATRKVTKTKLTGVNQADGIQFNRDGTKISYSKYSRVDNFSSGVHHVYVANADFSGEKKLTQFVDLKKLGFGFMPDGRVGVVGPTAVEAFSPASGKSEIVAQWKTPIQFRSFGGFSPDGASFVYDLGGPYVLTMFSFNLKMKKPTVVREQYFESFQPLVWVRVTPQL